MTSGSRPKGAHGLSAPTRCVCPVVPGQDGCCSRPGVAGVSVWRGERERHGAGAVCPRAASPARRVGDSRAQAGTPSPVLHHARGWGPHLSTRGQLSPGCSGQGGREGSEGTDQELWSPREQGGRAALEQGPGHPQPQWLVSHPLNVPSTGGDGVRALCQAPAILCPPAVTGRLPCVPWPSCVPGHSASPSHLQFPSRLGPLAVLCAAPDGPTGTSHCQNRNYTSGHSHLSSQAARHRHCPQSLTRCVGQHGRRPERRHGAPQHPIHSDNTAVPGADPRMELAQLLSTQYVPISASTGAAWQEPPAPGTQPHHPPGSTAP